jgi:hypothetical protein
MLLAARLLLVGPAAAQAPLPDEIALSPQFVAFTEELGTLSGVAPAAPGGRPEDHLVPVGRWVWLGKYPGYTYVDREQGLSAQTEVPTALLSDDPALAGMGSMAYMVRLSGWRGPGFRELTPEEHAAMGLPEVPDWLRAYGRQPKPGTLHGPWRLDPALWGRSLEEYPDDVEVLFDDRPPSPEGWESMWVSIRACKRTTCEGVLLNQPFHLRSVAQGDTVRFSTATVGPDEYLLPKGVAGPHVTRRPPVLDAE